MVFLISIFVIFKNISIYYLISYISFFLNITCKIEFDTKQIKIHGCFVYITVSIIKNVYLHEGCTILLLFY